MYQKKYNGYNSYGNNYGSNNGNNYANARGENDDKPGRKNFKSNAATPYGTFSLREAKLEDVMFINVESAPEVADFNDLTPMMQNLWKGMVETNEGESATDAYVRAGSVAEFGKVVCISVGVIRHRDNDKEPYFISQSYVGDIERETLADFSAMIDNFFAGRANRFLCGHGIRRGAVPFIAKRMLVNHVDLPALYLNKERRPISAYLIDTADYWTFSDAQARRVPAELLASIFGIDFEDDDYDYARCAELAQCEDTTDLVNRSERKLLVGAQLFRRFRGEGFIESDHVIRK